MPQPVRPASKGVEAHSVAAHKQQVVRWASLEMSVEGTTSGRTGFVQYLPPSEEPLERRSEPVQLDGPAPRAL